MTERTAKYLAVADTLKREILNGKYESHERFPSEETLARRFGASRPTVERALRELKREGLLESRSGSGSYLTFAARNATGALGVIAPDYHKIDFFTDLCDGIASAARAAGYDTLLGDVSAPEARDRGRWALDIANDVGPSPSKMLMRLRLDEAKRLMAAPDLTLAEIAARLGYCNAATLRRDRPTSLRTVCRSNTNYGERHSRLSW